MLIYLDNCCFNRPYDDQTHTNIYLETQAKLYIQESILTGKYQLAWSYILQFENDQNPYINHKHEIGKWKQVASCLIAPSTEVIDLAKEFQLLGLKAKDALHCASAASVKADAFISTDKQLVKIGQKFTKLNIISPLSFLQDETNI